MQLAVRDSLGAFTSLIPFAALCVASDSPGSPTVGELIELGPCKTQE